MNKFNLIKALIFSATSIILSTNAFGAGCAAIKDGTITDTKGNSILLGFDKWGYNYQAHMFNGLYDNNTRPDEPVTDGMVHLQMKWSDNWLSNKDCDNSGKLDRGGDGDDVGSKGWLTNHEEGTYLDDNDEEQFYSYFVKIVYMSNSAAECPDADRLWGTYCIIHEVLNDPGAKLTGLVQREKIFTPGLGEYK